MRRHNAYILTLLCLLSLCACNDSRRINAFTESDEIRLQTGGSVQLRYTPLTCQLSYSRDLKEFRVHTDNMSDYFCLSLSEIPVSEGQTVSGDLVWTSPRDVLARKNLALETVRLEGEKIWLWSRSARIGICVRTIDLE